MVAEMQNLSSPASISPALEQSWLKELEEIDLSLSHLDKDRSIARVYLISAQEAKAISEAIGFTARFDHENVQIAYFDVSGIEANIVFAMVKNTRPTDVGLRYMADRWSTTDTSSKRRPSGHSLAINYQAKQLPSSVWERLGDQLQLNGVAIDSLYIRVNLKSRVVFLITEQENEGILPAKAAFSSSLRAASTRPNQISTHSASEAPHSTMSTNNPVPGVDNSVPKGEPLSMVMLNEPMAKYATYSRSEIDLLFKKQAETVSSNLSAKIVNQQKALQEATRTQEQKISKIVDDLHVYCQAVYKRIENAEAKRSNSSPSVSDQSNKQIASEIEQFKSYLTKQVMPNLKSLEDRVLTMVNANILSKENKPERDHATSALALLALLVGIINLAILFVRH